ncbi:hypothetical protein BOTCAL_0089g00190 [Botryotinia calthae]|uniref:C3H1-type domain-containing protein n=1 Tax=Botryotinia calthae TaxID=38488 RepID=A0A4Y8D7K5_9HELO|nr:hypothetical protein BOTCAL_0089g00190 [Botryotinia calthae]
MSDYPYYGAAYGNREQSNNPPYPTYSNQSAYYPQDDGRSGQHTMAQGYDNTMAYGYNQQLPNYSAPAMQNNIPPVPVFQGWNQESSSMPQYNAAPQGMHSYAGYNHQSYAQNSQYYAPVAAPQPTYHSQTPAYGNIENREMSEGEYDDTSAHMHAAAPNASIGAPGSSHYRGNGGNGYLDTAHRAVYPTGQDPAPQQPPPTLRNAADYYNQRQPSASYSPFVSQSEPVFDQVKNSQTKDIGTGKGVLNTKRGGAQKKSKPQSPVGEPDNIASKSDQENIPSFTKGQVSETVGSSQSSQTDAYNDTVTFKTVAEARKKAEGAILNLWSYDVRFPAYLEEGVDEKLVGELFDELRLSKTATKTISAASAQSPPTSVSSAPTSGLPVTNGHPNGQVSAQNFTNKPKQAITNGAGAAPSATGQPKSAAAVEKEKTMQAKMDALRKSRAERAQKNAAKSVTTTATSLQSPIAQAKPAMLPELPTPVSNSTSFVEKVDEKNKVGATDPSSSTPTPALTVTTQFPQSNAPPPNIQQASQKIPGLFLASAPYAPSSVPQTIMPTPVLNAQRKLPVAADFDGPPTSTIPLKRPFGQSRMEPKPFVICVSEDEDESDEDVEMELESQADADSPIQPPRKLSEQKGLPTASSFLPPKPFTPPPTSSTSTPPNSQSSIKTHPEDLRRKESEIEQLKRKIAEAEMRKANKKTSSGAQTPINNVAASTSNIALVANKPNSPIEIQKATNISKDKTQSNSAQAAELQKAADIRKEEAELKRLRRERIASAIPLELRLVSAQPDCEIEPQSLAESEPKSASVPMELDDQIDDARDALQQPLQQPQQEPQQQEQSHTTDVTAASPIAIPPTQLNSVSDMAHDTTEDHSSVGKEASETNQDLEAVLQEAVRADADSAGPSDVEMEDSNAPPVQVIDATATPDEEKASSDYSPVLERSRPLATPSIPNLPDVVDASDIADVDSDNYEPPEATPAADETSSVASSPFSPAPPDSVIDVVEDGELPELSNGDSIDLEVISNGVDQSLPVEDGSVPQLTEKPPSSDSHSSSFFKPYESPLKVFHAFRFHPEYKQQIPGGLKSITYTNNIDAKKELCRYELMGGICNDNTCDFQHFREMGLPDDAVLTKLGSPDEFEGEQRDRFIEGLKSLLSGLRARKIKDFDAIASEIVAHRAKFLGDSSKVLSLEGTTL